MLHFLMLNTRREQVLDLVAESYIASARPVASAPVAERLGVSSATVRNDFAALEEYGYLLQPHTSAGRIPSPKGFEIYVRKFIPPGQLNMHEQRFVASSLAGRHGEALLQQIATVAAALSGYAVVVSLPLEHSLHALEVHMSILSSTKVLFVVVLENGLTKQRVIELEPSPSEDTLRDAETSLRRLGLPLSELPEALAQTAKRAEEELAHTLLALAAALSDLHPTRLYSQGLSNIFSEPESSDPDFVRKIINSVEQPNVTMNEHELSVILDDAVAHVSSQLQLGNSLGTLLLVGPTRMRYHKSLKVASGVTRSVNAYFDMN